MPAYMIIKVFKALRVDHALNEESNYSTTVDIKAYNPIHVNWQMIRATNEYEAEGKAHEQLRLWLADNKEEFDKDRKHANHVLETVFVWEINLQTAKAIAFIIADALKERKR